MTSMSTLSSAPSLASLFRTYASVAGDCLGRNADIVVRMGLEPDDIKELRDILWSLEDTYKDEEDESDDVEDLGEDEEF